MRKPVWHRDWAGFSGGWYGDRIGALELTVLGVYHFGYSVDVGGPLIGDVRFGYRTKLGRENDRRFSRDRNCRTFYIDRRSNAELRRDEAWAREQHARRRL